MDITARLQNLMHVESAAVAPCTNETIEIAREAKAEIERLTGLLAFGTETDAYRKLHAEIERLRAENKWLYSQMAAQKATAAARAHDDANTDRLTAENQRLRDCIARMAVTLAKAKNPTWDGEVG